MKESDRSILFICPNSSPANLSSVDFGKNVSTKKAGQATEPRTLSFSTGSGNRTEPVSFPTARCSEKGCVFPAAAPRSEKCAYHMHQEEEPVLFLSHQPTGLLLDPARMMPSGKGENDSRKRDRRRMAAIWEQFQTEGAP